MTRLIWVALIVAGTAFGSACKKDEDVKEPEVNTNTSDGDKSADKDSTDGSAETTESSAQLEQLVYFEHDSSELDSQSRAKLEENAEWMRENPKRTLTIEGHTDETGTNEYNLALGERRAKAAKDYLVRLGIADNRITIITFGEERPQSPENAKNRRSVFVATKK